ncbi:hypothetical protein BD413DRAFT_485899 [Trametes elegans]|nr:hypothetical protein BD413DRAFT_485899 [Trametes elegans]
MNPHDESQLPQQSPSFLLRGLRDTLCATHPFCSGTLELPKEDFELYYGKRNAKYVDLSEAAEHESDLADLADACKPASFGLGQETVLNETYRKAGKMDTENFLARFDVVRAGLADVARTSLMTGAAGEKDIRAELYKLNVYGKDAFFKPHRDTPRATNMFGSLVIVFPTLHEGGALVLRHQGSKWTFDAAELLASVGAGTPDAASHRVAYVAFFSDVEHEVLSVRSGHRVTLTYNLYEQPEPARPISSKRLTVQHPLRTNVSALQDALRAFLREPAVLRDGGMIGFGLQHTYPIPRMWDPNDIEPVESVMGALGGDAALSRACTALGLVPELRLAAQTREANYMLCELYPFSGETFGEENWGEELDEVLEREGTSYRNGHFKHLNKANMIQ